MTTANFYASFPNVPDELYDFPPQVTWKEDEDPNSPQVKIKISLTESETWDIKVYTKEEKLLSFILQNKVDVETDEKKWVAFDIDGTQKDEFRDSSIKELFDYCKENTVLSVGYAIDEVKSRVRRRLK